MLEFVFFLSVSAVFYVYLGYPLAAAGMACILRRKVKKTDAAPTVTVLIAAYNEHEAIAATVRNKLEQDYPSDRLEILVVSDGSTDGTDEIVRSFSDSRVRLLRQEPRAGKTSALNLAVPHASGDIIVFSDANSIYALDAIRQLVSNFADPTVGYVTGRMIYVNPDGSIIGEGCSTYMKYENALRETETRIGSVVGVDGGIDGVRKELYSPMNDDQLPDFVLPLKVVEKGYRVVYEPQALLKEDTLTQTTDEYKMRVRVSLRAFRALFDMRSLLLFKAGNRIFSWQLWSHKVLRYCCFIFLMTAFLSNLFLLQSGAVYLFSFFIQIILLAAAILALYTNRSDFLGKLLRFSYYFVLLNLASTHAFLKFLLGKKQVLWNPRKG